jgi:hypothetical protein
LACPASLVHYQFEPVQTTKASVIGAINMLGLPKRTKSRILQASTSEVCGVSTSRKPCSTKKLRIDDTAARPVAGRRSAHHRDALLRRARRHMMVRRLAPHLAHVGKRLVKSPKVHLRDSGLLHALLGIGTVTELQDHWDRRCLLGGLRGRLRCRAGAHALSAFGGGRGLPETSGRFVKTCSVRD